MARKRRSSAMPPASTGPTRTNAEAPLLWICAIVFLSGIPALIYQTVWQRILVLHSGVGTTSVAIIVTAYLLGLGIGSWLGARITRSLSAQRAAWMVIGLELAVGGYAILSPGLLYDVLYWQFGWLYRDMWMAALLHAATLVIPTMFMGATLPLLTRALLSERPELARSLGLVYGCNTLGAAAGALLSPWLLMPYVGIRGTLSLGAVCNLFVAICIWRLATKLSNTGQPVNSGSSQDRSTQDALTSHSANEVTPFDLSVGIALTFFTGLVAIGLEILWFRIIDIAVKSTAYTFGTVLFIYLFSMASGSIAASRWTGRVRKPLDAFLWAQLVVIGSASMALILILAVPQTLAARLPLIDWIYGYWAQGDPANPNVVSLGVTLTLYAAIPLFLMGPSAFAMGYSFTLLQLGTQQTGDRAGYRLGLLQAANICGCALGSLLVGLVLVDYLGTLGAWRALVIASLVFPCIGACLTSQRTSMLVSAGLMACVAWWIPGDQSLWLRLHGLDHQSSAYISEDVTGVTVLKREQGAQEKWSLSANGKVQSHLPFGGIHSKLGVLPVTLHAQPQNVAIIGLGSGDTAWAAGCVADLKDLLVFEILTSEVKVLQQAAAESSLTQLSSFLRDERFRIDGADARYRLMTNDQEYDIIEADAIRPNGAYAGYLYSEEFFRLCASRLKPQGLMCSWSPTTGTYATFCKAFPHVVELDGGNILIGSREPIEIDLAAWKARLGSPGVGQYLGEQVQKECLSSLETARPADPDRVPPWVNTDLFPFDEFH